MAALVKSFRRYIYKKSGLARRLSFLYRFVKTNKYWPNFRNPKTYNEKINYRKNNPKHELFSVCSDKIEAKNWVTNKIGTEYIIPNYFVDDSITPEQLKNIIQEKGDCFLKANHNSGPVRLLTTESTDEEIVDACNDVMGQLEVNFGKLKNEPWYSAIKPRVLVEKKLEAERGDADVRDYKFHVFKQEDGSYRIVLGVYFDRSSNITASFFDEELNYLPFSYNFSSVVTKVEKPKNFEKMVELAKELSSPFSYARIDFYNVDGNIYFGEITLADGSGSAAFSFYGYDLWMGSLWQGDPSY